MSRYHAKGTSTRAMTDAQVWEYRQAYAEGRMTRREIMLAAGVAMGTVDRMLSGETYQHLPTIEGRGRAPDSAEIEASLARLQGMVGGPAAADDMLAELEGMPPNPLDGG